MLDKTTTVRYHHLTLEGGSTTMAETLYIIGKDFNGGPEPTFTTLDDAVVAARTQADITGEPVPVYEADQLKGATEKVVVFPFAPEEVAP